MTEYRPELGAVLTRFDGVRARVVDYIGRGVIVRVLEADVGRSGVATFRVDPDYPSFRDWMRG